MQVDWFTVIAQILNFLVLVWLLKRFLYKPVLNAIEKRETTISSQLKQAAAKEAEAEKQRQDYLQSQQVLEQEQAKLKAQAAADAKAEKQRMLEQAQQEAASLRSKLRETLMNEQQKWSKQIMRQTMQEAFAIARKVLNDLSGTSLEEHITADFIGRLQALSEEEKARIRQSDTHQQLAVVQSAFPLAPPQQKAIENAIGEITGGKEPVRFGINPELISGIEVNLNGNRISWNVQRYLSSMENSIKEQLEQQHARDGKQQAAEPRS